MKRDFRDLTILENIIEEINFSRNAPEEYIKKAKKLAKKEAIEEYGDIGKDMTFYTLSELEDEYYEIAENTFPKDLWEAYKHYINFPMMIRDDILSGYISYYWFSREDAGGNIAIAFRTI